MKYMSAARKWGLTVRSVQIHCERGNVPGTTLVGKAWQIPVDAERPKRKPRARGLPTSVLEALKSEKRGRISGGLYHRLQIDFTYNSNHIEGSRLTHEQTRWIFETKKVGDLPEDLPVDNIVETCPAKNVRREMAKLLDWWKGAEKSFENLLDLHVRFEQIHPFQDGNGRVGRLILLKECLKYGITPFIIADDMRKFYYLGLQEWRQGSRLRLLDTCRTAQDIFIVGLRKFGHTKIAEKALAEQAKSEGKSLE